MSVVLRLFYSCLMCACLTACGGSGSNGGSDRQQIENVLAGISSAMRSGNYGSACGHFSQRQQANIVSGARRAGLNASRCSGALTSLIETTGVSRAQLAQAFGGAAPKLRSVSIHGNQATVTYTSTIGGRTYSETDMLVRQDGQWKADRIVNRSQAGPPNRTAGSPLT